MITTTYRTAAEFLERAAPMLEQREAANNLILGMSLRLKESPHTYETTPFFATVTDRERVILAAVMTPPYKLVLSSDADDYGDAVNSFAKNILSLHLPIPGVTAASALAANFAAQWARAAKVNYRVGMRQRIYRLRKVNLPKAAQGAMRLATRSDIDLATGWAIAFNDEALGTPAGNLRGLVERKIESRELYLWSDGEPVSMAATTRPTRHGVGVNLVYTPPQFRGTGYASSCVAALSQLQLDSGYQFCVLYTASTKRSATHPCAIRTNIFLKTVFKQNPNTF
jgi:predicted GNAT family acetyltransferase